MPDRRGQLLIASARLRDPNFFKTVVLLVKDDEEAALGVILNRPLEITVADAIAEQVDAASDVEEPIHQGGPCEGPLTALHTNFAAEGEEVCDGVRFTMDREAIEWLLANNKGPIKYFAGYSGWGKRPARRRDRRRRVGAHAGVSRSMSSSGRAIGRS